MTTESLLHRHEVAVVACPLDYHPKGVTCCGFLPGYTIKLPPSLRREEKFEWLSKKIRTSSHTTVLATNLKFVGYRVQFVAHELFELLVRLQFTGPRNVVMLYWL